MSSISKECDDLALDMLRLAGATPRLKSLVDSIETLAHGEEAVVSLVALRIVAMAAEFQALPHLHEDDRLSVRAILDSHIEAETEAARKRGGLGSCRETPKS